MYTLSIFWLDFFARRIIECNIYTNRIFYFFISFNRLFRNLCCFRTRYRRDCHCRAFREYSFHRTDMNRYFPCTLRKILCGIGYFFFFIACCVCILFIGCFLGCWFFLWGCLNFRCCLWFCCRLFRRRCICLLWNIRFSCLIRLLGRWRFCHCFRCWLFFNIFSIRWCNGRSKR